ncbi:hypothetical protein [Dyadobacter psychrotolerans]|uniref:Uncharacterized protein n=1 Tax=Dyadobacter psychrotolerans TaxID=2541721 RepID=A0A4R5DP04_9BACT|nr:hypothetical protein [Dyadobacter psychrotolerans]TDE13894.1 hypothetical protein E0F88_18595 [Dyadobacter psychrotolerans]
MKTIKLLTLLVLFSLQAGATGYSHNMFVAHKKLQAGKERSVTSGHAVARKAAPVKVVVKAAVITQDRQRAVSLTSQFANKISGVVTLNQRVVEQGPAALFQSEDEEASDNSIVNKLVGLVKGIVLAFIGSTTFGKA